MDGGGCILARWAAVRIECSFTAIDSLPSWSPGDADGLCVLRLSAAKPVHVKVAELRLPFMQRCGAFVSNLSIAALFVSQASSFSCAANDSSILTSFASNL